jgi:hypothetical protein
MELYNAEKGDRKPFTGQFWGNAVVSGSLWDLSV